MKGRALADDTSGRENVIAVSFAEDGNACQTLKLVRELDSQGQVAVEAAAVVSRSQDGQLTEQNETIDGNWAGRASGGLVGVLSESSVGRSES